MSHTPTPEITPINAEPEPSASHRGPRWTAGIVAIVAALTVAAVLVQNPDTAETTAPTVVLPSLCDPAIDCEPLTEDPVSPEPDEPPTAPRWAIPPVGVAARPSLPERADDAIDVLPTDDLAQLVQDNPPGTQYFLKTGTHELDRVIPKDGDQFIGETGTIIAGVNQAKQAFSGDADDVLIEGMVIEGFENPAQTGAIHTGSGATRWTIRWNEFRYNAGAGLGIGRGWVVQNNYVHHNRQIGFVSTGADGGLVENNQLAFNNYQDEYDMAWEAGGAKFVKSTGLVIRGNYVHDNHGVGLWTDIDNIDTLIEGNIVENNYGPGILHEISYDAVIRDNLVAGNAYEFYTGGILVSASVNVEVHDNMLVDNNGGVSAIQEDRGVGAYGPWVITGLLVRDNDVSYTEGWTGIADYARDGAVLSDSNRFVGNSYDVPEGSRAWMWGNELTKQEWSDLGQS